METIKYECIYNLSEKQILDLLEIFKGETWTKNMQIEGIKKMLEKSWIIAMIDSNNGNIIAFARVLSDFIYRAFIYDVIVAKEYRVLKFGKLIINSILTNKDFIGVERIELYCKDKNIEFYKKLGFEDISNGVNTLRYGGSVI
ncbi:putative GNAT family N-acyltransferase [Paenibacillus sp. W4I10]|uniref:GNAT family N-acetyltransferase n=1 Tax=Paenibacillus sp. W4I10 TaxID=3042298 RepID=UPI00278158E1|nr:GNAT family N-acetyltransferase [Paenibacillus sp. W4I10]MDQ0720106.1 putative GNAT family N-acyltransferase [Paenibacillus sp. W4I10]